MAMTRQEITDQADSLLAPYLPTIVSQQGAYFAANGHYWQGLPTHSTIPADGNAVAPDEGTSHPYYEPESWEQMGQLPAAMTACLRIDQYQGPAGAGYVVVMQIMIAGVLWQRSLNFGPETGRDQAWAAVPSGDGP